MEQHQLAETLEQYLKGELSNEERAAFEALRKTQPEIDQMVVEYQYFFGEMDRFGQIRRFKSNLHDTHHTLQENGDIKDFEPNSKTKIINLWSRYRRVIAVAASIAGVTALLISGMITVFSPRAPLRDIQELRRKVSHLEQQSSKQRAEFNTIKTKIEPGSDVKFGGTGFLVDPKGYLVTSAHVLKGAKKVYVQNSEGIDMLADILHQDMAADIALLKINDPDFKPIKQLPYGFKQNQNDLSEPVFTLGYPKNEIVYNEGYLSAKTGLGGDTMSCQITISANPGNSGGPVFNHHGEIIGILNARQASANGVVFATQSKHLFRLIEDLKGEENLNISIKKSSSVRGALRSQQVKRVQEHVYMVKVVLG